MLRSMLITSALAACSAALAAGGDEWPGGPNKDFFQKLQRPDAWQGSSDFECSCCGPGDVAKTIFKVIPADQRYPQDTWFAWLNESWERIPAAKIVPDFAPDGQAYLFVSHVGNKTDWAAPGYDVVLCFVRPKGGL
jgi:hypothetical protein